MIEYQYAKLYYAYRGPLGLAIRLLGVFFLMLLALSQLSHNTFPKFPLFFLGIFLMIEVFYRYKISRVFPSVSLPTNTGDINQSCTQPVLYAFLTKLTTPGIITDILRFEQARFILEKAGIAQKELTFISLPPEDLKRYAAETAKSLHGTFVTIMDVMAAYLLMTEEQTKLLFAKKLKPEDLLHILQWSRIEYSSEETPKKVRVHFEGGGIGEALTTGWTLETKKYTRDITSGLVRTQPSLVGRELEFKTMVDALLKTENNNVLLIGEPGIGKENLVSAFAYASYVGSVPAPVQNKQVLELMIGPLIAGTSDRSNLESRLQAIIEEVSHAGNVILYIPELQNMLGSSSFNIDLSGALLPYLKDGIIPIIATVTKGNYKTYLEQNPLKEVFELIKLDEPDKQTATFMLFDKTHTIEWHNRVIITYRALITAIGYANRYVDDGALPGSAVTLLEDTANTLSLSKIPYFDRTRKKLVLDDYVLKKIEEKTKIAVSAPNDAEKDLLLHLEDRLHERVIDQVEGITVIAEAMRRLRSGLASSTRPISFLFLGPTGVGKTETAKALADLYYGGEDNMIRLDMSEYSDQDGVRRLLGAAPGEGTERGELTDKIHDHPASLVLLDEFEKANTKIHDLFLQVLEDGRLTDNKGRTVSFINSIIIATSNAGAEFIREEIKKGTAVDKQFQQRLLDYLQTLKLFRPEFLNRFDDVVTFKPLGKSEVFKIAQLMLQSLAKKLLEKDINARFDDKLLTKIAMDGVNEEFGARPLRRFIQDNIEDIISQKMLKDEIKRGSSVVVTTDSANQIAVSVMS